MQGSITPNLWFDTEAEEAAAFYCRLPELADRERHALHRGRAAPGRNGDGRRVRARRPAVLGINGGPQFTFDEAISFRSTARPRRRSTTTGSGSPTAARRASAAGSRTGTACPGRSCRPAWGALRRPGPGAGRTGDEGHARDAQARPRGAAGGRRREQLADTERLRLVVCQPGAWSRRAGRPRVEEPGDAAADAACVGADRSVHADRLDATASISSNAAASSFPWWPSRNSSFR